MAKNKIVLGKVVIFALCINGLVAQRPYNDLRARYTTDPSQGFYEIPTNTSNPLIQNYVPTPADPDFNLPLNFYCYPDDPRVCFLYDFNGNIAGVQISYLFQDVANVNPVPYNYSAVGGFVQTNLMNTPAYAFRAYFTNPVNLTPNGRQNLNETVEGLWIILNGDLIEIQRNEPDPSQEYIAPGFFRQNCFPRMGQHYFYKLNESTPCSELLPFYPVYQGGGLVGFGIADFGNASDGPGRVWYERPALAGIQRIAPNRPACFDTWTTEYGLYSLHVYFVDHPWQITCPA